MGKNEVSVSVLNVDPDHAITDFYNLETAKVDYFHIDVMDGIFVENDTQDIMQEYANTLANITTIKQDIHLMVKDVKRFVDDYASLGRNKITFHIEVMKDRQETIDMINYIKETGNQVGLAINPDTPVESILEFLPLIHSVIVMTVVPGKGGQSLIESTLAKIVQLKKIIEDSNLDIDIEADGGIKDTNAELVRNAGANILIAGTYIVKNPNLTEAVRKIRGQ